MKAYPIIGKDITDWSQLKAGVVYQRGAGDPYLELEIYPVDGEWRSPVNVTVYNPGGDALRYREREATVNWASHGARPAAEAEAYARLILEAVEVAREFDAAFAAKKGKRS